MSNHISPFFFQGPINKLVYRCDELVLEQLGMVQAFKQLAEGSKTLQTDVKFKDVPPVDGRPVIVTMNGLSSKDIVKCFPTEYAAIENRCYFIQMDEPLKNAFNNTVHCPLSGSNDFANERCRCL